MDGLHVVSRNKIYNNGEFAEIILENSKKQEVARTFIDIEDIEKISSYRWFMKKDGRVVSNVTSLNMGVSHIRLHLLIMGINDFDLTHKLIDHIDKNPLNNRKTNLRIVNAQENISNRNTQKNSVTGVSGVIIKKDGSKYVAQIKYKRKMIRLVYTNDFDLAVKTRLIEEARLFKDYSSHYIISGDYWEINYINYDTKEPKYLRINREDFL